MSRVAKGDRENHKRHEVLEDHKARREKQFPYLASSLVPFVSFVPFVVLLASDTETPRGRSSAGRASGLQPEGQRFDPARLQWSEAAKKKNDSETAEKQVVPDEFRRGSLEFFRKVQRFQLTV